MTGRATDQKTDEDLMRAYQGGDSGSFDVLYSRHSGKVYGFLFSQLKNRARSDDAFQATFLKLHQVRHHYDPSFPFLPWLFTITKSVMVDMLRKEATRKEELNDAVVENAIAPEKEVPFTDLTILQGAQKSAIELRYNEDLSFEEIAQRLETTPANVRQLISRGIRKLKTLTSGGSK